jgi:hypothetical protein
VYSKLNADEPIRQGDIFRWLPKIDVVLGDALLPMLVEPEEKGGKEIDWFQYAQTAALAVTSPDEDVKTAAVSIRSVYGIVISQDCDVSRCENVVFAEVKPLKEIKAFKDMKEPPTASTVIKMVTEHTHKNQKWYFLSDSKDLSFDRKMAVDFDSIFEVKREMLIKYIEPLRIGRLDDEVAWPHFRERVAEFFRRYPYNEWYPLNADEARFYEEDQKKSDPNYVLEPRYRWQNP